MLIFQSFFQCLIVIELIVLPQMLLFHFQSYDYIHEYNDFNVYMEKGHKLQALLFTSIKVSRIHFFRAQIETFYYLIQLLIKKVALRSPIQYHLRIQYYV